MRRETGSVPQLPQVIESREERGFKGFCWGVLLTMIAAIAVVWLVIGPAVNAAAARCN